MTKSEAKAIEQRSGRALRVLSGIEDRDANLPAWWIGLTSEQIANVNAVIKVARDEVQSIHEIVLAESGRR